MGIRPGVWVAFTAGLALLVALVVWVFSDHKATARTARSPAASASGTIASQAPAAPVAGAIGPGAAFGGTRPTPPPVAAGDAVFNPHDLPMNPPIFATARDRNAYRGYWISEMIRRVGNYETLHPGRRYPNDATRDHLVSELYDTAEAPPPDATPQELARRASDVQRVLDDFRSWFGDAPMTVSSEGDDSRFGPPSDPPVLPPGMVRAPAIDVTPPTYIELKPGQKGPFDPVDPATVTSAR